MDQSRASRERTDASDGRTSPDDAIARIEDLAREIRDEQIEQAVSTLDETGQLTPKHRVVIAAMADRITEQLVTPVKSQLRAADDSDEERVALDLFGD